MSKEIFYYFYRMASDSTYFSLPNISFPNDIFHIDVTNNRVGINTTLPSYSLDISGTLNVNGAIYQNGNVFSGGGGGGGSSDWTSGSGVVYTTQNVGIGTSSVSGKLTLYSTSAGNASLHMDNTTASSYDGFVMKKSGVEKWYMGVDGSNSNADWILRKGASSNPLTVLQSNGFVGIATTNPTYPLYINQNNGVHPTGTLFYWVSGADRITQTSGFYGFGSLYTSDWIHSNLGYRTPSDQRIKKEMVELDDQESLSKINQLDVKRYKYIDQFNRTNQEVYGFIAQQVEQVVPYAVLKQKDFVPTIYQLLPLSQQTTEFVIVSILHKLDDATIHGEVASPLKIKVYDYHDKCYELNAEVIDANTLKLYKNADETMNLFEDKIFVFGPYVNDFRTLDKERIFTLSISAIQEIDRKYAQKIQQIEARLTALETSS